MEKIIFDNIIFYWQRSGGISVVWYELMKRFLENNDNIGFIDYDATSENKYYSKLNIPLARIVRRCSVKGLKLSRYLSVKVKSKTAFIFHSTYYRICRNRKAVNILTVHDFTYEYFRHGISKWLHCISKYYSIRKSDYIVCISENTKRDLLKFVPRVDEGKIRVIYNGVGKSFRMLDEELRYNEKDEKYLIFIGGRDGYKNFNIALETAKLVNMKLLIIGKKLSDKETMLVNSCIGNNYSDLGFIDDDKLNQIYNKAFALIYPSSYEGFGIPVIEAQKAGCPVIAMNRSSIPEVIGNKDLLIDTEDSGEFARKVRLLFDSEYRERTIKDGLCNSQRFCWDKTYEEYRSLYLSILEKENIRNN